MWLESWRFSHKVIIKKKKKITKLTYLLTINNKSFFLRQITKTRHHNAMASTPTSVFHFSFLFEIFLIINFFLIGWIISFNPFTSHKPLFFFFFLGIPPRNMTTRLDNYALGISSGVPKKMAVINLLLLSFQNSPLYLYIYIYIYI